VSNQGGGTLNWNASEDEPWLDLSPTSGSLGPGQSATINVTISDPDLSRGQYQGIITVAAPNAVDSPRTSSVSLTYIEKPRIGLSASSLTFTADEGIDPEPQTLVITNTGEGSLGWGAVDDEGWLSLTPSTGSLGPGQSQSLVVSVSPGALPGGAYEATLTISDPNSSNSPQSVGVGLTVVPRPRIGLDPGDISFTTLENEDPESQTLVISNLGGQTLNWAATLSDVGWLELSIASGALESGQSQSVTVWANSGERDPGVYEATITVADPWAMNSPQIVPVTLIVQPRVPPVISNLAVNLVKFEDPTCPVYEVRASRFEITFNYSDLDGDLPISGGSFVGTPVRTRWTSSWTGKTVNSTASVEGNRFSGQAGNQLCLSDQYSGTLDVWVALRDAWALLSNELHLTVPPWGGPSSPPQDTVPLAPPTLSGTGSALIQKGAGR
jgi:hypothetical protein